MFDFYILMSLCTDEWGGAKWKHIITINIFVKTFAFVIMAQVALNCFLAWMVWFLISNSNSGWS
jgi:hypothetical protein